MTQLDRAVDSTLALVLARFVTPALLALCAALGSLVWADVKHTLETVQLIQFQQIKDGKDIERHGDELRRLDSRVDRIETGGNSKKMNFNPAVDFEALP
jgi:hypothetical protein